MKTYLIAYVLRHGIPKPTALLYKMCPWREGNFGYELKKDVYLVNTGNE
jgi:hypothetical protein